MLTEIDSVINVLSPAADRYNTNPAGDYINAKYFNKISFLLSQTTGGTNTGTATVTVLAATDAAGAGAEAIEFKYRKKTTGASAAWGAVVDAAAAGFTTTANEDTIYEVEVEAAKLPQDKPFLTLKLTEVVDDPVTASVIAIGREARYQGQSTLDPLA